MDNQKQYDYIGHNVQIGTGFGGMKPLAQQGLITIGNSILSLYDSKQRLIDQAPLSQVTIKPIKWVFGATLFVYLDTRRYSVAVGHGEMMWGSVTLAPGAVLLDSLRGNKQFRAAFEELSKKK